MDRKVRSNMLKRQLKMDKVDRSKRAVEYKRELALQKLEEDAARQKQIKAFKDAVTEERKEMQRQALIQQVEMERKVEQVKKKMAKESAKAAESVIQAAKGDLEQAAEMEARDGPASAPSSPNPALKKRRNRPKDGQLEPMDNMSDAGTPEHGMRSSSSHGMGATKSAGRSRSGGARQTAAMGREHKALMAEDQVQAMWRGQNERLLRLLEEEEVREAEREQAIKAVQYEMMERQRLEREFDKERQDARERIVTMTQQHERQLLMRMSELGLIGQDGTGSGAHMVFA